MATDNEDILEAVQGIGAAQVEATTQITGRMDTLDGRMSTFDGRLTAQGKDIAAVRESHTSHRAFHDGVETAEAKAAQSGARDKADDREKEKTFSSRLKLALTMGALLVSVVVYIVSGIGASDERPVPTETEKLQASIDQLAKALGRVLDKPDPATPTVSNRTAGTASARGGS